ncbi:hypothetical protein [Actinosynnema sp. NPDC020468]|uniref:hypothetical protein n=1 Tax=Actinosynnema sp. NPDC020468 TaxID=3154488 RepID=UPI003400E231
MPAGDPRVRVIPALPGPRAHLDRITADLDAGFSCLWLVPDALVASGVAEELLADLAARPDSVRVVPPSVVEVERPPAVPTVDGRALPSWAVGHPAFEEVAWSPAPEPVHVPVVRLADRVAGMLVGGPYDDPVDAVAASPEARRRVVVVCGWEEDDPAAVGAFLSRMSAARAPRVLVAARTGDVRAGALDPLTGRTHWWWGVTGRLDTAVVVGTGRPGLRGAVAREVVVELAGPDLDLAASLARSWDGRVEALEGLLDVVSPSVVPVGGGHTGHPPAALREPWSRGLADLWEGQVRVSPRAVPPGRRAEVVRSLVWRAQHRALTPVLDDARAAIEVVFRSRASTAVLAEVARDPDAPLELGPMCWAVAHLGVRIPQHERRLLSRLRDARNALAHLRPVTDDDLDGIEKLLG